MPANAASQYVVPTGTAIGHSIFGPDFGKHDYPNPSAIFNVDDRGAFGSTQDAWNAQRLGLGVLDAPDGLNAASQEAMNRYLGDPNNGGQGGWNARWNQWNATNVTDPSTGQTYYSPMQQNGMRISQGFGGRDEHGNPINPMLSNTNQGFTFMQNRLAQNPDLQTGNIMGGYNQAMTGSPFHAANASQYLDAISPADGRRAMASIGSNGASAIHSLGDQANFDQFGLRGIQQTNDIDTANLQKLTRNIDTQSQQTLANQLPQVQQAMEAAGLGRSGAGQMALMQNQNQILSQANRDKQSVLADFMDRNANRQAGAINLATQQGYGGLGQTFGANVNAVNQATQMGGQAQNQWSALQGNAAMQGMQGQDQFAMLGQKGMSDLYGQTMANANQRYGMDTGNYLQSILGSGQQINQQNALQAQAQSQAQADWLNLQANRDQSQQNSMSQMLSLQSAQRQIAQDRLNQMLQAGYMPYDTSMRIATGTTAPAGPQPSQGGFWQGGLGQAAAQGAGNMVFGDGSKGSGLINTFWQGST